jgi:hypothetical protein
MDWTGYWRRFIELLGHLSEWVQYSDLLRELWGAVQDRWTKANVFRVVLLLFVLWVTLRLIGRVNGVRGKETWRVTVKIKDAKLDERDMVRLTWRTIRANSATDKGTIQKYDERSGTIEFRPPVPMDTFWQRMRARFWFPLTPDLIKACNFEVRDADRDTVFVGATTYETLLNNVRKNGSPDLASLDNEPFDVTVKRGNSLKFLLDHPDRTLKTTAWVILVGSLFEILKSILFEK